MCSIIQIQQIKLFLASGYNLESICDGDGNCDGDCDGNGDGNSEFVLNCCDCGARALKIDGRTTWRMGNECVGSTYAANVPGETRRHCAVLRV